MKNKKKKRYFLKDKLFSYATKLENFVKVIKINMKEKKI